MTDVLSKSENEIRKYFAFNETGNIMVSTTVQSEPELRVEAVETFQKVAVLFDAVVTALSRAGRDINDYDALNRLLGTSEWAAQVHSEYRTLRVDANSTAINVALILDIIGDVSLTGSAMMVAKSVLASIAGKATKMSDDNGMFVVSTNDTEQHERVAHVLFVCEDLMGMPLVTIQLIHVNKNQELFKVHVGKCGERTSEHLDIMYQMDTYMFVDPSYIHRFTPEFYNDPEFENLIDSFRRVVLGESDKPGLEKVAGKAVKK